MSEKKSTTKKRYWAFVLYPESAPEDWRDRLQQTGLQCCISPLHDRDTEPTGEPKKAHYHVIGCYPGPTTYNAVKTLTDSLRQPIPQPLDSVRGYYRYLTHQDNPDKFQYDESDIQTINGFNILDFVELTRSEVANIKRRLQVIIRERGFTEYSQLMDYCMDEGSFEEYDVASCNTLFFDRYVSSRRHKKAPRMSVDPETGEVLED